MTDLPMPPDDPRAPTVPHYADDAVTLWHGDCLDVLRTLPDNSVDSVVTDPPYGLEFMGKDWDRFATGRGAKYAKGGDLDEDAITDRSGKGGAGPTYVSRPAKRCSKCGKQAWSGSPCTCEEPVWILDNSPLHSFQQWCELWAAECLRVLKPGGHMLAFGGTRTWHRLACAVEDAGFEVRDSIAWLYGSGFPKSLDVSKAIDKAAGAEREVVGPGGKSGKVRSAMAGDFAGEWDTTAPATDAARTWQGWGTALKPAHEPVVVARKPQVRTGVVDTIGSHLDGLEAEWQALEADRTTTTGRAAGSSAATATSASVSTAEKFWSTVTSWQECWAVLLRGGSTSTTGTTTEPTIDLRTLSSCLSKLTAANMVDSATSPPGLTPLATAVDHLFASAVCDLRVTLALSAIEPATGSTLHSRPAEAGRASTYEPIVVARKPLQGTVAQSVLTWGTGAINVDACRVGTGDDRTSGGAQGSMPQPMDWGTATGRERPTGGRWPANVVLSDDQAAELDRQSGTSDSRSGGLTTRLGTGGIMNAAPPGTPPRTGHDDSGGASRFFPTFRYEAKAPTVERPRVKAEGETGRVAGTPARTGRECNVCGNRTVPKGGSPWPACGHEDWSTFVTEDKSADMVAHPTVKPLDLMRWLVRLVTPPGGTVLEPFAGSGTTAEACVIEGFRCIAIEREATYLPLIVARLSKPIQPDLFGGVA